MPDRPPIEFECSTCLTRISAPAYECGNEIECPSCRASVLVPSRSIDLNLFADIFDSLNGVADKTSESPLQDLGKEVVPPPATRLPSSPVQKTPIKEPPVLETPVQKTPVMETPEKVVPVKDDSIKKTGPEQASSQGVSPGNVSAGEKLTGQKAAAQKVAAQNVAGQKVAGKKTGNRPVTDDERAPEEKQLDFLAAEPTGHRKRRVKRSRHNEKVEPKIEKSAEENQPLSVAGLETTDLSTAFGVKCHVCDTRIHLSKTQIGTRIECPICFTSLKITAPPPPKKTKRWKSPPAAAGESSLRKMFGDADWKSLPPAQPSQNEFPVDPSYGLEPITVDLLAPIAPEGLESAEPIETESTRQRGIEKPESISQSSILRPRNQPQRSRDPALAPPRDSSGGMEDHATTDGRPLDWDALNLDEAYNSTIRFAPLVSEMLLSPGLRWRAVVATLLIGGGSGIMHFIAAAYRAVESPQLGDWILNLLLWLGFGGGPYLLGTVLLWFISGYVFRAAATGHRQVTQWSVSSATDLWQTFLIFGFSFFVAGLPLVLISFLTTPLRFLFAPPLLLSAWFHQSPFSIVAVEVFQNFQQDWQRWRALYWFLLLLTGVSLMAGLLMMVQVFILSAVSSVVGALMMVLATIAFADATGWHCGQVMRGLKKR